MSLIALSNLPWDIAFRAGVGPGLDASARTHRGSRETAAPWLDPSLASAIDYEDVGGSPTNVALAFAGLGGNASIVGPVASDARWARIRAALAARGVALHEILPAPETQALSLAFADRDGERRFLATFPGLVAEASLPPVDLRGPGWITASAYELEDPVMRRIVLEAFRAAADGGRKLAFDLADPHFVRRHRSAIRSLVDLGLAALLAGGDALDAFLEVDPGKPLAATVIVSLGAGGVRVLHGGGAETIPAAAATIRDTTGAGDALFGAFLFGSSRGLDALGAVRLGVRAAAEAVTVVGAHLPPSRWDALRAGWREPASPGRVRPGGGTE